MDSTRHLADCRRGGNHCCHISLVISKAYAMVIAKDTGRTINHNDGRALDDVDVDEATAAQVVFTEQYKWTPCAFLNANERQAYEHRSLACRLQLNLDDDDLLCKLVQEGPGPRVLYLKNASP